MRAQTLIPAGLLPCLLLWGLLGGAPAQAQDLVTFVVTGETDKGTPYEGKVKAQDGKVLARLSIQGIKKKQRFEATIPAHKRLIGITLTETKVASGLTAQLDPSRASRTEGDRSFTMTPLVESDLKLVVVNADGSELDLEREYLIGQKVELKAFLTTRTGTTAEITSLAASYAWRVPGEQVKSYDVQMKTEDGEKLQFVHGRRDKAGAERYEEIIGITSEPLASKHLQDQSLSFHWRSEGAGPVTIKVRADVTVDGAVERLVGEVALKVRRDPNPARHVFTKGELPGGFEVLPNHAGWHSAYRGTDKFIMFHREFLRFYNSWRTMFGYLKIMAEFDPTKPGYGEEIANYTYLTEEGGTTESPFHKASKLADFESISELGDDLESPFHNRGHGSISRNDNLDNMGSVAKAPTCEEFFQWHTKVDNVALDYEDLMDEQTLTKSGPKAPIFKEREDDPEFPDLSGMWSVTGTLPNGDAFTGDAVVSKTGKNLYFIQGLGSVSDQGLLWKADAIRTADGLQVQHHTDVKGIAGRILPGHTGELPAITATYTIEKAGDGEKGFGGGYSLETDRGAKVGTIKYTRGATPTVVFDPPQVTIRAGETVEVKVTATPATSMPMIWVEDTGWMIQGVKMNRAAGAKLVRLEGQGTGFYKLVVRLGKDPRGKILGEARVRVIARVVDEIEVEVKTAASQNLNPIVVFDLDSTLFDPRYRAAAILESYGKDNTSMRLRKVPVESIRHSLFETLAALQFTQAQIQGAEGRAIKDYFDVEYPAGKNFHLDKPIQGAVAYVNKLKAAGARIVYVSERSAGAEAETKAALGAAGFPDGDLESQLRSGSVSKWKAGVVQRLSTEGTLVAAFDDESRVANAMKDALRTGWVVRLETRAKPGSPALESGIETLGDFR